MLRCSRCGLSALPTPEVCLASLVHQESDACSIIIIITVVIIIAVIAIPRRLTSKGELTARVLSDQQ